MVYPCFGGRDTLFSKVGLCKILRSIDPALCFLLPEDRDRAAEAMDGEQAFVIKRDVNPAVLSSFNSNHGVWVAEGEARSHFDLVRYHKGNAVQFITSPAQLPRINTASETSTVMVQPLFKPFLGNGCMARKWDVKAYIGVVSIDPPRFYIWRDLDVIVARNLYDPAAPVSNDCVYDTHYVSAKGDCYEPCVVDTKGWPKDGHHSHANGTHAVGRMMNLSTYMALAALPSNTSDVLLNRIHDLMSTVLHHPDVLAGFAANPLTKVHVWGLGTSVSTISRGDLRSLSPPLPAAALTLRLHKLVAKFMGC